jgi:hypothetical protein
MRKSIIALTAALLMTLSANAQFQQGKGYVGASLSGLDIHYSGAGKLNLGVQAKAGYLFFDNLMGVGGVGFDHFRRDNNTKVDRFSATVGGRYYIIQNGLYLGVNGTVMYEKQQVKEVDPLTGNASWKKAGKTYTDVLPGIEVGYAFFVNRSVTIEPAIYYDQSFKKHSDYSTIGLRVGVGVDLFDD